MLLLRDLFADVVSREIQGQFQFQYQLPQQRFLTALHSARM